MRMAPGGASPSPSAISTMHLLCPIWELQVHFRIDKFMKTFTSGELSAILFKWLYSACSNCVFSVDPRLRDTKYVLPTKDSVREFALELWQYFSALGIYGKYHKDGLDCDNFAIMANSLATVKHTRNQKIKAGLAFGSVFYRPNWFKDEGYHIANFFVTVEDNDYKVYGFEPQCCSIFEFTKEEIHTIKWIELS